MGVESWEVPAEGNQVLDQGFCPPEDILEDVEGSHHNLLGVEDIHHNLLVGEAVPGLCN